MPDLLAPLDYTIGTIIEWSGLLSAIPYSWALCDGGTYFGIVTPDLHAKFLRGAPAGSEAGTTAGEDTHALTIAEMPSHNHSFGESAHSHSVNVQVNNKHFSGDGDAAQPKTYTSNSVGSGLTINNNGSGTPHENRPAFLELAYIMKVKH